ncbi:hypothetical protein GCM10017600_66530 [Streptosporangium carneum]|uniref:Uncharacterized protein n=1 Tax=Streptosporangium carneum TaxID=47481 RepID=A0A9W6MGJ9_9ACTN|nr:hypothetical protein GCM10017600_66530 [Streptosporangium carneum]
MGKEGNESAVTAVRKNGAPPPTRHTLPGHEAWQRACPAPYGERTGQGDL